MVVRELRYFPHDEHGVVVPQILGVGARTQDGKVGTDSQLLGRGAQHPAVENGGSDVAVYRDKAKDGLWCRNFEIKSAYCRPSCLLESFVGSS